MPDLGKGGDGAASTKPESSFPRDSLHRPDFSMTELYK